VLVPLPQLDIFRRYQRSTRGVMDLNLRVIPQSLGEDVRNGRRLLRLKELILVFRVQRDRGKESL
jgi:hypothetical protein